MKILFSYLHLFLFFMPFDLMAERLTKGSIFLDNEELAAIYCTANIFPDKENVISYKSNIVEGGSIIYIYLFESPIGDNTDYMGGGGVSYEYEYDINKKTCHLKSKSLMR